MYCFGLLTVRKMYSQVIPRGHVRLGSHLFVIKCLITVCASWSAEIRVDVMILVSPGLQDESRVQRHAWSLLGEALY